MSNAFLSLLTSSLLTTSASSFAVSEVTDSTKKANENVLRELPFSSKQDFEDATRGLIAPLPNNGVIKNDKNETVWDLSLYNFLKNQGPAPATVNPSLWRQSQLLDQAGLFKVVDGLYQIRGADLSNMTIIEGKEGIIVIDPLVSKETAKAALELYYQNRPKKPIKAVIYTHSHIDHFGGVKGIISQADVDSGKIKVIAPKGFTEAALDENVMAGNAMGRRATYMYGNLLKPGPEGQVSSGLGLITSTGEATLILPTELISKTGQKMTVDGIDFEFLFAPGSEAPAEMLFFLPQFKALEAAEDATHNMHNLYTLRGAKVRDAKAWAHYLNQAIELFGPNIEVVFAQHHWPVWGHDRAIDFLEKQLDLYKYIHDQTLRLANQGYTMLEIAEMIQLPPALANEWYNRGYYGSLSHNAKAVYNFYLGWFDGNPSTLAQLPPVEASKKYVEYMGGPDAILAKAQQDYQKGNYRWTAQVLNHVVYADPSNKPAKDLLANTLEQLGYQAENGTWRNFYLTGAKELREGVNRNLPAPNPANSDMVAAMPTETFLDYLAIRLNGLKAAEHPLSFNLKFPDQNTEYLVQVKNGVLNYTKGKTSPQADATITLNRQDFNRLITGEAKGSDLLKDKKMTIEGNAEILTTFKSLLDHFEFWFNIVEPKPSDH
jgi:alkyl sulfatase BDS1-like metallo-beta-lactamase superfamily hydrolase